MDFNVQDVVEIKTRDIESNGKVYRIFKRGIDIICALFGCILLLPLTIGIWLANIFVKDNGPIFYVQKRIGKNGKVFTMYKFRSMVVNADKKLKGYLLDNPEANKEFKKYRKLKDDPRITKVGNFLRKTSLDEFPQFINILKGDMSLVGPRPYLPRERRVMKKHYKEIIKTKPGLTGPWQVNGRSEVSLEDRLLMDVAYVQNENLVNDAKYVLKTIKNILKDNKGAM